VIKKLAVLINLNNLQAPDEENYANFKSMIEPFPPQLVERVEIENREGNLLQYAVKTNQKKYLQILLDYGLDPMAPRPRSRPSPHDVILSPLEDAIARGHMEVWELLKDHVEMTVELKLEQLYNMIVSSENQDRKEPYTVQFRELLSSVPIGSVTLISKGDPPVTRTLLQAAAQHGDKEAVQLLLQHGVDLKETSDEERTSMKLAAENYNDDIVEILRDAIGGEIPDDIKMLQLAKAMQQNDKEKFSELLGSLSPELVSSTGIDENGSVLQYAVLRSPDFIRPLLEHGVDPTVGSNTKEETPVETAAERAAEYRFFLDRLTLFTEFVELPTQIKIKYVKLLIQSDEDHFDIIQKQLQSLSDSATEELAAARVRAELHRSLCWSDASLVQYLASEAGKSTKLQLLLSHGVDPRATTDEVSFTPLEIAAINGNMGAFDLLAPHYEDNTKKKMAQLMIWGLTDSVPSAEFILLFKSVPLAEVGLK
jgi:ankyrin repeat protein